MQNLRHLFVLLLFTVFFSTGANAGGYSEAQAPVSELKQADADPGSNGTLLSEEDFSLLAIPAFGQKIHSSVFTPRFFAANTGTVSMQPADFFSDTFLHSFCEQSSFAFRGHLFFCVLRC